MTRNIAVVTGTRAEYGLLRSSMEEIQRIDGLSLSLLVTGMHLSPQYGHTVDEIRDDGFEVTREIHMLLDGDSGTSMGKSLGVGILGFADAFEGDRPDVVLVLGDRGEPFAAGIAAAHVNIPVAHVHGGDVTRGGTIDDSIRDALTNFAHLHFPATEESRTRILGLGEEPWRVTTVGAPGLDDVLAGRHDDPEQVLARYDIGETRPLVLVVQHPLTTDPVSAGEQMRATLDALVDLDVELVIIYPNADAGGKRIIQAIKDHPVSNAATVFKSLPRREYLAILEAADVIAGNSSSAIIEAPSVDLPVVDIGPRQRARERAEYIIHVEHAAEDIEAAILSCLEEDSIREEARRCDNPYDFGGAGRRIAETLAAVEIDDRLIRKHSSKR